MIWAAAQVLVAWYYGHLAEWLIHKYVLHRFGTKKKSLWSFHFKEHHAVCRRNGNVDKGYKGCKKTVVPNNRVGKETYSLLFLAGIHLPLFPFVPWFVITVWASIVQYYYMHRKSHIDIEWGKKHLPWHYDHHMGKNQHLNWGVRSDMIDRLFGTRKDYLSESSKGSSDSSSK